ncbi:hypothetical protein PAECIP111893_00021 [Paenibacillus plantiphilus]|uniref:histidine kinase n=1 Tax=Paenibacillus plantiphilus TaxID=2905650 RepID=A0ABM9BLJ2_9BACL|nr:histidine kinase [Paenibacillus plantiphilus]CAH1189923.1 hypothetical protein PAECIP111893_00021 [Paenibacillus plantiphilus]
MNIQRFSPVLWCLLCLLVLGTFLPMVMLDQEHRYNGDRNSLTVLTKSWEISFGTDDPDKAQWLPLDQARERLDGYVGPVLLQRFMPDLTWDKPYLYFLLLDRFEVYLEGKSIYAFNREDSNNHINPDLVLHAVPVDPELNGKHLLIRTEWNGRPLFGHDLVLVGELDQLLYLSLVSELSFFIYALLSLIAGIIGFVLFIRRKERIYGWFALFCLSMGFLLLFSCRSLQWFLNVREIYYWKELNVPIAIWACISFYAHALRTERQRIVQVVRLAMAVYVLALVAMAAVVPQWFLNVQGNGNVIAAIVAFGVMTYSLARYSRSRRRQGGGDGKAVMQPEQLWLFRGYWTFTVSTLFYLLAYLEPGPMTYLLNAAPYLFRVIEGLLPNALFLFMICMVMTIVGRVRSVHLESERNAAELMVKNGELEQFHRNLEGLVETRTAELEKANRTLAVTLREKAETFAEMSVLEERNRIAYEMHDVVGHTLTAAIVQLEATRRLAQREGGVPEGKLDLLEELVRKGLNDIRKAVRLMTTDDEQELSLEASLRELIQYTKDTMEIALEADIVLPPGLLIGKLTKNVIYHALQEGLTNGIRHGHSRSFRFTLGMDGELLRFLLVSDGEPLGTAKPGFGLASMMERVQLLDGEMSLRSSVSDEGEPRGCELSIAIPLPSASIIE